MPRGYEIEPTDMSDKDLKTIIKDLLALQDLLEFVANAAEEVGDEIEKIGDEYISDGFNEDIVRVLKKIASDPGTFSAADYADGVESIMREKHEALE